MLPRKYIAYLKKEKRLISIKTMSTWWTDNLCGVTDFFENTYRVDVDCIIYQSTGLHDATPWGELSAEQQKEWLDKGRSKEEWTGIEIFDGHILKEICPRGNIYRIMEAPGGFVINEFQDELEKVVFTASIADMQQRDYLQGQCKVIGHVATDFNLLKRKKNGK